MKLPVTGVPLGLLHKIKLELLISRLKGLSSVTDRLRWTDAWLMLRYAVLSLHYAVGGGGQVKRSVLNMF